MPPRVVWTHFALHVTDLDASIDFYTSFTGLKKIHEREDPVNHMRSAWLSDRPDGRETEFVLVLIQGKPESPENAYPQIPLGPLSHLGFSLTSREEVDSVAYQAKIGGILMFGPVYLNEDAGYLCLVRDPDGHRVEFSYGQVLG